MSAVVIYEGYVLETDGHTYQSNIDGRVRKFDTAGMWKQYIDYYLKKKENGKTE